MAGLIPQDFINDLISRLDIVEVVQSRVPMKRAGREYQACCPFHDENTPSFTVSPHKQFYHCFGCGAHGNAIGFVMEYDRIGFVDAVEELAEQLGLQVPRQAGHRPSVDERLYDVLASAETFFRNQLKKDPAAIEYLKQRGLSGEVAARYKIGLAPQGWDVLTKALGTSQDGIKLLKDAGLTTERDRGGHYDKFRHRIMFPIHDTRGRPIAFGGRLFAGEDGPKYLNSPETRLFHKGRQLYGLYQARQSGRKLERLIVVEGYMDVLALHQHGFTESVATLGTATTPEHAELLFRSATEVVFCFDGDRAGRQAAGRALESVLPRLRDGRQVRFLFLPDGEDPDSMVNQHGQEGFQKQLQAAMPLSDFFFTQYSDGLDLSALDGRATLVERCRPKLSQVPEGAFRDLMFERLSQMAKTQVPLQQAEQQTPERQQRTSKSSQPSLIRRMLTILVQKPNLAANLADTDYLDRLDRPGIDLLVEVVAWCKANASLHTAHLLTQFQEHPHGVHLVKLAAESLLADNHDLDGELQQGMQQLQKEAVKQRIGQLQNKQQQFGTSGLTDDEKNELRRLLTGKVM